MDLWDVDYDCTRETLHIISGDKDYYVQAIYHSKAAELVLTLSDMPKREIMSVVRHIFKSHREIMSVEIANCLTKLPMSRVRTYFRVELPDSVEGLQQRMSRKHRYNLKRESKILKEAEGPVIFEEYTSENFPPNIFTDFNKLKRASFPTKYGAYHLPDEQGYIDHMRLVSNIYVMKNSRNEEIISMVLSCEQTQYASLQNLTYDTKYSEYSPGKMLFHHYIEELTKKGKRELHMGFGNYKYKMHYGCITHPVYFTVFYRHFCQRAAYVVKLYGKLALFKIFSLKTVVLLYDAVMDILESVKELGHCIIHGR